uniref:Uncharacterized protein n=1 Tax=Candidatus Kentrum sp. LFY TaxID=2126342 RepID=A0A450W6V5_9GAMM|nr:MAG: hypothetical protein BECKLFY1418C_GA0070996_100182 [Candidatus Kentron sp. LFY]
MSATPKDLHNAILDAFKAKFGERIKTYGAYRPFETAPIKTPAILLNLEDAGLGEDIGDKRTPMLWQVTLHCILSFQTPDVEVAIRDFASQVFRMVPYNKWGLGSDVSFPSQQDLHAGPGEFKEGKHGFESWYVTWPQTLYLGESLWDEEEFVIADVYVGSDPELQTGDGDFRKISDY